MPDPRVTNLADQLIVGRGAPRSHGRWREDLNESPAIARVPLDYLVVVALWL